jgi:hypothetical protein
VLTGIVKLPTCVRGFIAELSDYVKSDMKFDECLKTSDPFSVKDGKGRINLRISVISSPANYNKFILDFEDAKKKWHVLSSYTSLVFHGELMPIEEVPEEFRNKNNCRAWGLHIEISLKDLLLDKLSYFFHPESELSVSESIELLRKCGMSNLVIMSTLGIPKTSYRRYCANTETKTESTETKVGLVKTEQKAKLTTLLNNK